ncbi:MAG: IS110 family transposase [Phycisphaerales bacterium]
MRVIHPNAAGIDIGADFIFIAVEDQAVVSFETFTDALHQARDYLLAHHIETVAMEATGIYWLPLYEILEAAGLEVFLVNGAHVKNVPGRKSDVLDCQWIEQLHSCGLLRKSFIPEAQIRQLRTYLRLRDDHIELGAMHIQHMHKALELMNIKLHRVISQIQGKSGLRIVEAMLAGERDAEVLAALCQRQILNRKRSEVIRSLAGTYQAEHLFALEQALTAWRFYQQQIQQCDQKIEALLEEMTAAIEQPDEIQPPKPIRHNKPAIADLHTKLMKLTGGRDASQLPGLTDLTLMKLISEVGTDMSRWPSAKHFVSWLGLSPGVHQSGKRRWRRRSRRKSRAGQIFRESAQSLAGSKHLALGGFYRRLRAKRGPAIAIVATARKLAIMFYNVLRYGMAYVEQGLHRYEQRYKEQIIRSLQRRAKALGLQLVVPNPEPMVH